MGVPQGDQGVRVPWTRAEVVAVREAIEVTPLFEGRSLARELVRSAIRDRRSHGVTLPADTAYRLSRRLVPSDTVTALARVKLMQAVRDLGRSTGSGVRAAR